MMGILKVINPYVGLGILVAIILAFSSGAFIGGRYEKNIYVAKIAEIVEKYERATTVETNRQLAVQQKTQELTNQVIGTLQVQKSGLEEQLRKNEEEANHDPNADTPSVSLDGVRRLNKIH